MPVCIWRSPGRHCLKCGHVGFLGPKALSRAGVAPSTAVVRVCLPLVRLRHNGRHEGGLSQDHVLDEILIVVSLT